MKHDLLRLLLSFYCDLSFEIFLKNLLWDRSHKKIIYGSGPSLWGTGQTFMGLVHQKSVHIRKPSRNVPLNTLLKLSCLNIELCYIGENIE